MTEAECEACTEPAKMFPVVAAKSSHRQVRLFACACCRQIWHLLPDERSRSAVEAAERYSDGLLGGGDLRRAAGGGYRARKKLLAADRRPGPLLNACYAAENAAKPDRVLALLVASQSSEALAGVGPGTGATNLELAIAKTAQVGFLRDIFGNPFRHASVNPTCLTPTVVSLARAAYEDRILPSGELDSQRLLVLANALEEAGCTSVDVIRHLRSTGPHLRGCWAVDHCLSRS